MSYDRIDRFLRNNLGDDDYAEYSAALDSLCTQPRKPLTSQEINQIEARWDAFMHGSKIAFVVRETEAAHNIKDNT